MRQAVTLNLPPYTHTRTQPYAQVHLLKKNPGSGCAFLAFDRWSSCEAAIEALHGKTQLEGAKMPIVVKFADAKVGHEVNRARAGCAQRTFD